MSPRVVLTTIIVKSVGKVAFSTSFFPPPNPPNPPPPPPPPTAPGPGPMLSKTLMFVCVIVMLHPNTE